MSNKYAGEIDFTVGTKKGTLVFDYQALTALKTEIGDKATSNLFGASPEEIIKILVIGFKRISPDMTEEFLRESYPPVHTQLAAKAIDTALVYAHWGPDEAKKILDEQEALSDQIKEITKKKTD